MKRIYLSGHRTFANRGCEAIVRSTVQLLRERFGDTEVLVPSDAVERDHRQWPQAADHGVRFVPAYYPSHARYWAHIQRLPLKPLKQAGWPFPLPRALRSTLEEVDAVLAVGGDNYSLDYRLPSLMMGVDRLAMDLERPLALWGASVGPFEAEPDFVPVVREHLARMQLITVREGVSERYLQENLGLRNVARVSDPAFTLEPEAVDIDPFWPAGSGGVLGLNVSPVLERYRQRPGELLEEVAAFIARAIDEYQLSVLLVPHVVPLDDAPGNNDARYMQPLLERLGRYGDRVRMMDRRLNAAQIKHVLAQCRFFIGARTHATIAALSSGVPTTSIAYSIKAKGINHDLFGHTGYVLETPKLSADELEQQLKLLLDGERLIRRQLGETMQAVRARSAAAAERLQELLP